MNYTEEDYTNWPKADLNDFIADNGRWLSVGVFCEGYVPEYTKYTLRIKEHEGFPSAYQIIAHSKSEYDAAMKLCGDWAIWMRWKGTKGIWEGNVSQYKGTGLKDAVEAMEARIASEALALIIEKSKGGDYRASKDLVTWNLPKKRTGKKVKQVAEAGRDNIFDLADKITKGTK